MIVTDTNIIVRLLTKDDKIQHEQSDRLFASERHIWIPLTILLETAWVLESTYEYDKAQISQALKRLGGLSNVELEKTQAIAQALEWLSNGVELDDGLHLAQTKQIAGVQQFITFDQKLIKRGDPLVNFSIQEPT